MIGWQNYDETKRLRVLVIGGMVAALMPLAFGSAGGKRLATAAILAGFLVLRFPERALAILRSWLGRSILGLFSMVAVLDLHGGEAGHHLLGAGLALGVYSVWVLALEGRRVSELWTLESLRDLPLGLLLGFTFAAFSGWLIGGVALDDLDIGALWPILAAAIFAGVCEEVLFRGMLLRLIEERSGSALALLISALLFAWVHMDSQGADTFFAGLALGACYLATGRLWLSISGHTAHNFVLGAVDSTRAREVEGLVYSHWTTAVPYFALSILLTLVLIHLARRKGRWVPLRWGRAPGQINLHNPKG